MPLWRSCAAAVSPSKAMAPEEDFDSGFLFGVESRLNAGAFLDALHPRGKGGKFAKKGEWDRFDELTHDYNLERKMRNLFGHTTDDGKLTLGVDEVEVDDDSISIYGSIFDNDGMEGVGQFQRTIRRDGSVSHDWLEVDDRFQKSGLARSMMRDVIPKYQEMGLSRIELEAGLSVGGYAWAKHGFELKPGTVIELRGDKGGQAPLGFRRVHQAVERGEASMLELANWKGVDSNNEPVSGKDYLLGSHWHGYVNLRDAAHVRRALKAFGALADEHLQAGVFSDVLHPRGPGGKFAKKLTDATDDVKEAAKPGDAAGAELIDEFAAMKARIAAEEAAKGIIRNADGEVVKYPVDGVEPHEDAISMSEARMHAALSRHADAYGDFAGYDAAESMEDARTSALAALANDATDGTPSVFMREEHFDRLLNSDGRVKSQFETNWSSGAFNNDLRNRYEGTHVIGIDPGDKIAPSARPIYGALTNDDDREYGTLARTYGQVELQLHDGVLDRSTLTFGDSLNGNLFAIPARRAPSMPDHRLLTAAGSDYINYTVDYMAGMQDISEGRPYRELQIHGGVSLDDVRNIHFHRGRLSGEWEFERDRTELKRKLDARKISWTED